MVKREFEAKIVDDFRNKWLETTARQENSHIDKVVSEHDSLDLMLLSDRISGKIVTLIESEYLEHGTCFSEKINDSYAIDKSLFTEI